MPAEAKRYVVQFKLPSLPSWNMHHEATVQAGDIGQAVAKAYRQIKGRKGVVRKHLLQASIQVVQVIEANTNAEEE